MSQKVELRENSGCHMTENFVLKYGMLRKASPDTAGEDHSLVIMMYSQTARIENICILNCMNKMLYDSFKYHLDIRL